MQKSWYILLQQLFCVNRKVAEISPGRNEAEYEQRIDGRKKADDS